MNQYTKPFTKEEIAFAEFHKQTCRASARRLKRKIDFAEEQIKQLKEDWHRLNAKSRQPIGRIIKNERKRKENAGN